MIVKYSFEVLLLQIEPKPSKLNDGEELYNRIGTCFWPKYYQNRKVKPFICNLKVDFYKYLN